MAGPAERRKRKGQPGTLREAYRRVIEPGPVGERLKEAEAFRLWDDAVGPTLARQFQPAALRDGVLTVIYDNPVWANELSLRRQAILDAINNRLDRPRLKDLRFRIGSLGSAPKSARADRPPPQPMVPPPEAALAQIADPALRAAFRRVAELLTAAWPERGE